MSARSRERSRALAAWLKDHEVERTTFKCPMSCGAILPVNRMDTLIIHLGKCRSGKKVNNQKGASNVRKR